MRSFIGSGLYGISKINRHVFFGFANELTAAKIGRDEIACEVRPVTRYRYTAVCKCNDTRNSIGLIIVNIYSSEKRKNTYRLIFDVLQVELNIIVGNF